MVSAIVRAIKKQNRFSFMMIYQRALNENIYNSEEELQQAILTQLGVLNEQPKRTEIKTQED